MEPKWKNAPTPALCSLAVKYREIFFAESERTGAGALSGERPRLAMSLSSGQAL
ncbi:MAG: hypothetical protein R2748_17470 [Bryobacterales bacterium]